MPDAQESAIDRDPQPVPPALSIVTISFNQAPFLEECIDSVARERGEGVEYIVVDAGSSDGSRDILARRARDIDRLVLEPDHGPADGLNKGFAAARGEIFGYVNADDRILPGAVSFAREFFAEHIDTDVLCGAIRLIDREGCPSPRARVSDMFDMARYAAGICMIGQQATYFRREIFTRAGGFNTENRIAWDGELMVDMALAGARFATTSKLLGDWRIYSGSITGSKSHRSRLDEYYRVLRERLRARQVSLYTPAQVALLRIAYKLNPLRHLRYYLAR
jgi:glycosyltransferase involved in cell wall biosynthesis